MSEAEVRERIEYLYEFDGYRFYPGERLIVRFRDNHPFQLTPKANALMLVLVKRHGEVVTYDELKKEVWSDTPHVLPHTIRETKHALVKVLGNIADKLETVTGKGYRFNVEAIERRAESTACTETDRNAAHSDADLEKLEGSAAFEAEPEVV